MWFQPYLHLLLRAVNGGAPRSSGRGLLGLGLRSARRVASGGLVLLTAGDWDYRELVLNWVLHDRVPAPLQRAGA